MQFNFLIPVYNQEKRIRRCLDSIPKDWKEEIIVVDDGSTDDTYSILLDYQKQCPNLKIYRNEENKGSTDTYNRCLDLARGDYIVILDSDDVFLPTIDEVLSLVDGTYDVYYYNMVMKNGTTHVKSPENRYSLSGNFKVIRREFIGNARYTHGGFGDWYFNKALMDREPKEFYTNIFAYWYNYPREGSVSDLVGKGLLKP